MPIRILAVRTAALVVAAAVWFAAATPALAQIADRGLCTAMASGTECGRGSLVSSCCCSDAQPATPADRLAAADSLPSFSPSGGVDARLPFVLPAPTCPSAAPPHGYHRVPLHTLFSALLI